MEDIREKYGLRWIIEPLFRLNFFYCNDPTKEEYAEKFLKLNGIPTEVEECGGRFEGIYQEESGVERGMMWVPNDETDVLSHEVFHATHWALNDRRNITLTNENEELYAYYIQYLTKECLSKGHDDRIKIRKDLPAKRKRKPRKKTKA